MSGHSLLPAMPPIDVYPVEPVDWWMSHRVMSRHGLILPHAAQWEYGCRAGTSTPWYAAGEKLQGMISLQYLRHPFTPQRPIVHSRLAFLWKDNSISRGMMRALKTTSPVGCHEPNTFGIHDMMGNVYEWCQDSFDSHLQRISAVAILPLDNRPRIARGGYYGRGIHLARSAHYGDMPPDYQARGTGLRPARLLRPRR